MAATNEPWTRSTAERCRHSHPRILQPEPHLPQLEPHGPALRGKTDPRAMPQESSTGTRRARRPTRI
eukprot:9328286-Pyramimonas_sp.AAC.1